MQLTKSNTTLTWTNSINYSTNCMYRLLALHWLLSLWSEKCEVLQKIVANAYWNRAYGLDALTSLNSPPLVTKYTPPSCMASYVWRVNHNYSVSSIEVLKNYNSMVPSTAISSRRNRFVFLDSKHMLHMLQQLRLRSVALQDGAGNTDDRE